MGQWGYYDDQGDPVQDLVIAIENKVLPKNLSSCKTHTEEKINNNKFNIYTTKDNERCSNNRIEYMKSNLDKISDYVKKSFKNDDRYFLIPGIAIYAARGWRQTSHFPKELPKNYPKWLKEKAQEYSQTQLDGLCRSNWNSKNIDVVCKGLSELSKWKDWKSREQALKNQIKLFSNSSDDNILVKLLTVESVKKNYWNKKTKKGAEIHYYSFQSYGGKINNKPPKVAPDSFEIFIPDGSLKHTVDGKEKIIKDWLSKSTVGPYKKKDAGKGQPDFYYLGGWRIYSKKREKYWAQICSGPLNVVSEDCLDEVNWWVKVDNNPKQTEPTLCPRKWEGKAEEYALTIGDILDFKPGEEVELLLLHRNIFDGTTRPNVNKPKYHYTPKHFFRNEKWIYTHTKNLKGSLRMVNGDDLEVSDFEWELNISDYDATDKYVGSLSWYPLENGKMKPLKNKQWSTFPKDTLVGWRGPAIYWDNLKDLPKITYIKDGCLVCGNEANACNY